MLVTDIIGYSAASISVIAYGTQFFHTIRCGSVEGMSLGRTIFDTVSLVLWVAYATRVEDIPLLIATGCELVMCVCVTVIVMKEKMKITVIADSAANPVVILQMTGINYINTCNINTARINHSTHKTLQLSDGAKTPTIQSHEYTDPPGSELC